MNYLILDDHPLVRKGIISVITSFDEKSSIYEADNVDLAIELTMKNNIDISIIDLNLGKSNGLDYVLTAKLKFPHIKCVILTSSLKQEDFTKAQKLNVEGYILKEALAEDIIYALKIVLKGRKYVDPEIMHITSTMPKYSVLTPREYDILAEVGHGLTNYDIAKKLFISEFTVKKHLSNILTKLDLKNRTEAALYAVNIINF